MSQNLSPVRYYMSSSPKRSTKRSPRRSPRMSPKMSPKRSPTYGTRRNQSSKRKLVQRTSYLFPNWKKAMTKHFITLGQIKSLEVGKSLDAFILSKPNLPKFQKDRNYRPSTVFRLLEVSIIRQNDETLRCTISYKHSTIEFSSFDFEVEIDNKYYPITNNYVNFKAVNPNDNRVMHWTDLSTSTNIAFFGDPLVLSKHIDKFSLFFH